MSKYDSIIIGSGINSLVVAALLGKQNKKVLVLESREQIGGLSSTIELKKGFKCNAIHDSLKWIDPRLMKTLKLQDHGLKIIKPDIVRIALGLEGKHIFFNRDPSKTADSISNISEIDSLKWIEFVHYLKKLSELLEKLYTIPPPKIPDLKMADVLSLRPMLAPLLKQGPRGFVDLLRVAPMMMNELMDEWFENELLRSAISASGVHHLSLGPYSAGTGFNLLHQNLYSDCGIYNSLFIKGGTIELANTLKKVAESYQVEFRTNSQVKSIKVNQKCCEGIILENGENIKSSFVVSGLDPHNTFINLVGSSNLNPDFLTQVNNIRYRGSTARLFFILKNLPEIEGVNSNQMNTNFSICTSMESLEKASDGVKYGKISDTPFVDFNIPTILNENFAINNQHILAASVQYAPYHLRNQIWDDQTKSILKKNTMKVIENIIPNFSNLIESSHVLSPEDIENEFGLKEGNLNHGEMTLDQFMFMRPTISSSQYTTPIKNLYICGGGTHPGGGLHGGNGYNAAKTILNKW